MLDGPLISCILSAELMTQSTTLVKIISEFSNNKITNLCKRDLGELKLEAAMEKHLANSSLFQPCNVSSPEAHAVRLSC